MRAGKISDIEGLRGIAVLAVMCYHVFSYLVLVPEYFRHGWSGVDLFFVISGFVVTRAFHRDLKTASIPVGTSTKTLAIKTAFNPNGDPNVDPNTNANASADPDPSSLGGNNWPHNRRALQRFYIKRVYRILPTLLVCLGFWVICLNWFNTSGVFGNYQANQVWSQISAIVLMYANYVKAFYSFDIHLFPVWSLSVEEQFYVLFPLFALFIRDRGWRIAWLAVFIFAIAGVHRPLSQRPWTYLNYASDMRFDELAAGVLLAEVTFLLAAANIDPFKALRSPAGKFVGRVIISCLLIGIVTMGWFFDGDLTGAYKIGCLAVMILAFPTVWLASADLDLLSFGISPLKRILEYLGSRSYALYLYHMPADWVMRELLHRFVFLKNLGFQHYGSLKDALFYSVIVLALVELNYRFIEKPFIRLAHRKYGSIAETLFKASAQKASRIV